jgi:hypothetical protein
VRGSHLSLPQNLCQQLRHLRQHLPIAEANHPNPASAQIAAALGIPAQSLIAEVLPTIQLDRQPQRCTVEIQHIGRQEILPAELETAELAISQVLPGNCSQSVSS